MGLGETIGYSTRLNQNNYGVLYDDNSDAREVHIALMGDPTLRMHIVAPPSALLVSSNGSGGVNLSWNASPDAVLGYHVYCAPTSAGPFARLTTNVLTSLSYTDPLVSTNVYMVRAVKLEVSGSGSYYNASEGIFQSLDGSAGAPAINLFQPTNNTAFGVQPTIQFSADTFDPANCITNVEFYANGVQIGQTNAPPYSLLWTNVPGGSYSLTARAICRSGLATNSSAVNVQVDNGGSPVLAISPLGNGAFAITGDDFLGRIYRIEFLADLTATNWQVLGSATSSPAGSFQFIDPTGAPQRFYRSVYP
jgi:hypothetical protein